ncbi:type II toxin-antitoxin system PemK/MazF family toxin [Paludibaculum fermentans]|uniref:type II toxin-antitoxin system PemK/MazF family toxin n=1 Tax=Paludibaculum fermentans TaxID=1473598 RepID=UPI003EB9D8CB
MPISFVPEPGTVLICDFSGFQPPEMTKKRPVIVLSNRSRVCFPDTYIVVPVSKTAPAPPEGCHCGFSPRSYDFFDQAETVWAKANMVTCVGRHRLDRVRMGGRYMSPRLRAADLQRVRQSVLYAIGMSDWRGPEAAPETESSPKASKQVDEEAKRPASVILTGDAS